MPTHRTSRPAVLERGRGRDPRREVAGQRDDRRARRGDDREAHQGSTRNREVDHGGERAVQELLPIETYERARHASDGKQQQALEHDRAPQLDARKALELELRQARTPLPDHVRDRCRHRHRQHRDREDQRVYRQQAPGDDERSRPDRARLARRGIEASGRKELYQPRGGYTHWPHCHSIVTATLGVGDARAAWR